MDLGWNQDHIHLNGLNRIFLDIQELEMIYGSSFYKVLKTSTTRKSHNTKGVANEDFFMD